METDDPGMRVRLLTMTPIRWKMIMQMRIEGWVGLCQWNMVYWCMDENPESTRHSERRFHVRCLVLTCPVEPCRALSFG